jgi:hypothetical protein
MDFAIFLKGLHNLLRWIVVLGGIWALVTVVRGLAGKLRYDRAAESAGKFFVGILDAQVVVGVILYLVSPFIKSAMAAGMAVAMQNADVRFFLVEHVIIMVLAAVAAHVGLATARRGATDQARYTRALIWYLVSAVLIVIGTPWGRSLIPWG